MSLTGSNATRSSDGEGFLAVAYSPDGETVVLGTKGVEVRDRKTMAIIEEFRSKSLVRDVVFCHDGASIALLAGSEVRLARRGSGKSRLLHTRPRPTIEASA